MNQFTVPQFIERETRVFGPITVRQFFLMLIAIGLIVLSYKLIGSAIVFVFISILIAGIFSTFAFAKINGRPFHHFILNVSEVYKRPKLRVWNKKVTVSAKEQLAKKEIVSEKEDTGPIVPKKPLPPSQLSKLSLVVNTGGAYREEE